MARTYCPTCRQEFDTEKTPAMPFCSERCRLIDLGHWFNEEVSMPIERDRELDHYKIDEPQDPEKGERQK